VRIDLLHLIGFGRFERLELELQQGFNLVFGRNEAGKTTVQRFVELMLFGVKKDGMTRRQYMEEHDLYLPWSGAPYEGRMVFTLADNSKLEVFRRFDRSNEDLSIHDAKLGTDIGNRFVVDKRGEILFAAELLGIGRPTFLNSVSIGQLALSRGFSETTDLSGDVIKALSGGGDEKASRALELLYKALDQVGKTERAKRSGELIASLENLEKQHRQAVEYRLDLNIHKERLAAVQKGLERDKEAAKTIKEKIASTDITNLSATLAAIKNLKEKIEHNEKSLEKYSSFAEFPNELKDQIQRLEDKRTSCEEALEKSREKADRLKKELDDLDNRLRPFTPYLNMDQGAGEEMVELRARWKQAEENIVALHSQIGAGLVKSEERLNRFEELNELFERLGEDVDRQVTDLNQEEEELSGELLELSEKAGKAIWARRSSRAIGVGLGLLGCCCTLATVLLAIFAYFGAMDPGWALPALAAVSVIALAGVLIVRWRGRRFGTEGEKAAQRYEELQRRRKELREERRTILSIAGVHDANELMKKKAEFDALKESLEDNSVLLQQKRLPQLEDELKKIESRIIFLLQAVGIGVKGRPSDELIRTFITSIKQAYELFDKRQLKAELYNEIKRELESLEYDVREALHWLEKLYTDAKVRGYAEFIEKFEGKRSFLSHQGELNRHRETLEGLLSGRSVEAIERDLKEARRIADEEASGEIPLDEESRQRLERELEQIEDRISSARSERDQLVGIIATMETGFTDPGLLELEIERSREELGRIRMRREALGMAIRGIEEATERMHADFAPAVNRLVGEICERITGGRYREVMLSNEFQIAVRPPESDNIRPMNVLSAGARDQLVFAVRLAVADMLGRSKEAIPVLLDDSFVEYDEARAENAMQVLKDLSQERQIIFFTCHRREKELAEKIFSDGLNVVELGV
jgi:uncharacterized protein YhaN